MSASNKVTEADFEKAVRKHDFTYFYSDDRASYKRGLESLERVEHLALALPRPVAVRIWNAVVDERIDKDFRTSFYWKETT